MLIQSADEGTQALILSLKDGSALLEQPQGGVVLQCPDVRASLGTPALGVLAALRMLSSDGATVEHLMNLVVQHDGVHGLSQMYSYLQHFAQHGLLCHTATWNGSKLATLVPIAPAYRGLATEPVANTRYATSRFAYLHKDGEYFVLESPLAHACLILRHWRAMALLHILATPQSLEELCSACQDMPHASVAMLVRLLLSCQVLYDVQATEPVVEQQSALTQWEFHDLLFHTRSRRGRHANPCGATFRFLGKIEPLLAVKPPMTETIISLYKPDLAVLRANDLPFTQILEERKSIRKHGTQPITVEQLGEFLYRTARLKARSSTESTVYERSSRPYPSGGACYELEIYMVVNVCTGLDSGLYHYCPDLHQLSQVTGRTHAVEVLLEGAYYAADQQGMPQVLFILAARFQRVTWKYATMAYAAILKNVGVLYQTMYLVATAMGLAPCALGSGNSDAFTTAAGTDYYTETSVGEFMLGTPAEE